jgi:hypothetical protein
MNHPAFLALNRLQMRRSTFENVETRRAGLARERDRKKVLKEAQVRALADLLDLGRMLDQAIRRAALRPAPQVNTGMRIGPAFDRLGERRNQGRDKGGEQHVKD